MEKSLLKDEFVLSVLIFFVYMGHANSRYKQKIRTHRKKLQRKLSSL